MSITADCQLLILGHLGLDHGGLVVHKLLHSQDYLENVFPVQVLAILEPLNHVVDELLGHLVSKLGTIVAGVNSHVFQIQAFCCRGCISHLDGLEEGIALDQLLTCVVLDLCGSVAWLLLDDNLPVVDGVRVSENCRVCDCSSVVCLDEIRVHFYRLGCIGYCVSIGLKLDVCL